MSGRRSSRPDTDENRPFGGRGLLECLSCCLQGPNGTLNPHEPLSIIHRGGSSLSDANAIKYTPRATHTLRTSRRPQPSRAGLGNSNRAWLASENFNPSNHCVIGLHTNANRSLTHLGYYILW